MFITFEGGEGSGKSTQIKLLSAYFSAVSIKHIVTMQPGGTMLGQALRQQLLEHTALTISTLTELFLFCADRAQHVSEVILPALKADAVVLCDRYTDATVAYQGYARGIDINRIRHLNEYASSGLRPDMTILLDIPVETGLARVDARRCSTSANITGSDIDVDRFETEKVGFHEKVRQGYLDIARQEQERFVVIDATSAVDTIHEKIKNYVNKRMGL